MPRRRLPVQDTQVQDVQAWVVPDLTPILHKLARQYFPDAKALPVIVWHFPRRKTTNEVTFGWYRPCEKFIYISLALSQPWVPRKFLQYIVYHELCHFMQDVYPVEGEPVHSDRFLEWEARMPGAAKWDAWSQTNLDQYIREHNRLVKASNGGR
jgi:hypothetical protein